MSLNPNHLCAAIAKLPEVRLAEIWNAANISDVEGLSLLAEVMDENLSVTKGNRGNAILAHALGQMICEVDSHPRDWNTSVILGWFAEQVAK